MPLASRLAARERKREATRLNARVRARKTATILCEHQDQGHDQDVDVKDSRIAQQWEDQGIAKGGAAALRGSVVRVLRKRFPDTAVPEEVVPGSNRHTGTRFADAPLSGGPGTFG